MTCRTPANNGQITSGDLLGPVSCVAYSAAYAIGAATSCKQNPSGETVRNWTNDANGGLELSQIDAAIEGHYNFSVSTVTLTRSQFWARIDSGGWVAVLIGGYGPIADSPYSGQDTFRGNHAICVPPAIKVMDPLADGRSAGWGTAYRYQDAAYPRALVNSFASRLRLSTGLYAGTDRFDASFLRIPSVVLPPSKVSVLPGTIFYEYDVLYGPPRHITGRHSRKTVNGFSAHCTDAANWPAAGGSYKLVKLVGGSRDGMFIGIRNPRIRYTEG